MGCILLRCLCEESQSNLDTNFGVSAVPMGSFIILINTLARVTVMEKNFWDESSKKMTQVMPKNDQS